MGSSFVIVAVAGDVLVADVVVGAMIVIFVAVGDGVDDGCGDGVVVDGGESVAVTVAVTVAITAAITIAINLFTVIRQFLFCYAVQNQLRLTMVKSVLFPTCSSTAAVVDTNDIYENIVAVATDYWLV